MEFGVLGALRVVRSDGGEVRLPSVSQRRLVSALTLRAGAVASADWLAELLDVSPGALRTSVSRLRAALGYDLLVTKAPGYMLATDAVDAARFERQLELAHKEVDQEGATQLLLAALELWRGPAYEEFADEDWVRVEVARLEELRAGAHEDLIEQRVGAGDVTDAIARLTAHIDEHPYRERPRLLMLRALSAGGRNTEALRHYQQYRTLLAEEIGTEPGSELQALEREIASGATPPTDLAHHSDAGASATPAGPPGPSLPQGTVTFLLTDIAGSTRMWVRDSDAMARATALHYEILSRVIAEHDGARPQEQGEGDSVVAVFTTPRMAIDAAIAAQRALEATTWPTDEPLRVRMALHTGEAHLRDAQNYAGMSVIVAARLRDLANGGQVVVSEATRDLVHREVRDGVVLADRGEHRLRDIAERERVFELCYPGYDPTHPPLRSDDEVPTNLPLRADRFVGRDSELGELQSTLSQRRFVSLVGPGGSGKSRLALEVAHAVRDEFPDGVWWIELAPLSDATAATLTLAEVVGARVVDASSALDAIGKRMAGDTALLVLDNCEHLLDDVATLASTLLRGCPGLRIMCTSRAVIDAADEHVWHTPGLRIPGVSVGLDSIASSDAVALLVERGAKARAGFAVASSNADALGEICRRLDGMPLAIELAASRLRSLSPEQILAGLDDALRLLTTGSADGPSRHRTLEASIEWSVGLLEPQERALLHELSVFSGGFDLASVTSVCFERSPEEGPDVEVVDALESLLDHALIDVVEGGDTPRFRQLEMVRQYGFGRIDEERGRELRRAHAHYFDGLAARTAPLVETSEEVTACATISADIDNLRSALVWFWDEEPARLPQLVDSLAFYWTMVGAMTEAESWLTRAIGQSDSGTSRSRLLAHRSTVRNNLGTYVGGLQDAHEVIGLGADEQDPWALGRCRWALADMGVYGDLDRWAAASDAAVEALEASGDTYALTYSKIWKAVPHLIRGDQRTGLAALDRAQPAVDSLANPTAAASAQAWRAWAAFHSGDLDQAERLSLAILESAAFRLMIQRSFAECLYAAVRVRRGTDASLMDEFFEKIEDARRRGEETAVIVYEQWLAHEWLFSDASSAAALAEQLQARGGPVGPLACFARVTAGLAALALDDIAAAREHSTKASSLAKEVRWPLYEVRCDYLAALLPSAELSERRDLAERAVHRARECHLGLELAQCLEVAASVAEPDPAKRHLAELDRLTSTLGLEVEFLPTRAALRSVRG